MVRFILSDSKATLVDGIFTYSLDQRLNNASLLHLKKCSFQLTTTGTPPVAIYLRSAAVHRLSSHKHRLTTTNPARISSGFSRKVTLLGDTSSEDSLDQCVSNIRISETSTSTSQTQQEPTSWRGQEVGPHRPIFYPPPISLLEPTCRPSLIFPTKPRSPSAPRPPSPVSRRRMTLIRLSPLRTERLLGIRTTEPTEGNA